MDTRKKNQNILFADMVLKTKFDTLHKDKLRLHEKKKSYFHKREGLIKTGAQLVLRRKQLIAELAYIYPIVEVKYGFLAIPKTVQWYIWNSYLFKLLSFSLIQIH
mgnify:CR=1 FL=1